MTQELSSLKQRFLGPFGYPEGSSFYTNLIGATLWTRNINTFATAPSGINFYLI